MANIKGTNKNDRLKGKAEADTILGLGGNDYLFGLAGDDVLNGGKGNDVLDGGSGADRFNGGAGEDTASYAKATGEVLVNLATGFTKYDATGDTFSKIENLTGGRFNDILFGDNGSNRLKGGAGHDTLNGGGGDDVLIGGKGSDVLEGGGGADIHVGGSGFDSVYYSSATQSVSLDLLKGKAAGAAKGDVFKSIEVFAGSAFADTMKGTNKDDYFIGGYGDDTLVGRGGNDSLFGFHGADKLVGGKGDDRLYPGDDQDADVIIGGGGNDWVDYYYTTGADGVQVYLSVGIAEFGAKGDTFSGIENVSGSHFNDSLSPAKNGWAYGVGGDDIVFDAQGTEVLRGGAGLDTLVDNFFGTEDGLKDIFVLEPDNGLDTVIGFNQGQDLFWLPADMFDKLLFNTDGELAGGRVVNTNTPTPTNTYAQLIFDMDDSMLWYDADGVGGIAPVQVASISGFSGTLSVSDFLVMDI